MEKILFVIDALLKDDYGLCESFGDVLDRRYAKSVWAEVAEILKSRLATQVISTNDRSSGDYARVYRRESMSGWIIRALEAAGDDVAATNFCIDEATKAGSYQRAVDRLIAMKRYDEAKALALQGLENTDPKYAGLINRQQDSLAPLPPKATTIPLLPRLLLNVSLRVPMFRLFRSCCKLQKRQSATVRQRRSPCIFWKPENALHLQRPQTHRPRSIEISSVANKLLAVLGPTPRAS